MSKYHLYHISFFDAIFQGLKSNGVCVDNITQSSFINRFDINNQNTYLPIQVSYELFKKLKYNQSIDCFASTFYGGFEMEDLNEYGSYLTKCPDLYTILINAIQYDHLIQTSGQLQLKTNGATTWFTMKHVDAPSEGRYISERINLVMILKAFHFVLGSDWTPLEVNITSTNGYWLQDLLPSCNFKLNTSCNEIGICFNTSEMYTKNKSYVKQNTLKATDVTSIKAVTEKVLTSLDSDTYFPTLEEFSHYFGYSKRTLIRSYVKAKTSYKSILEKQKFLKALELLQYKSIQVGEISASLGFSHPSNFIRAFKRWTSKTPIQYREQVYNLDNNSFV